MNEPMNPPCPRQAEATLMVQASHKCEWRDDTWIPGKEIPIATRYQDGKETVISTGIAWRVEWGTPPRTCSYCGGIKPSDLLRMLTDGWGIEATSKDYKRYVNPPGTAKRREAFINALKEGIELQPQDSPMTPTPCVKFYVYHCTEEEINRLNFELKNRRSLR